MIDTPICPNRQGPRCAGCNTPGETPRLVFDRSAPQPTILRPTFVGEHVPMLCDACRKAQRQHDRRRARRKGLASDQAGLDLDDKGRWP